MNPEFVGKWLSDKTTTEYGSSYNMRELMLNVVSINEVRIAYNTTGKWSVHSNIFEVVGNQIQLRGVVYFVITSILDSNNVVLYNTSKKHAYHMLRVPNVG